MRENFKLEIISPEKVIFSGEVKMVTVPSYEGDMSFLNNHISTIAFLRPGIIKVRKEENVFEIFFVEDGTVEYFNESLIILSTSVINTKDLTKKFVEELNENALKKLDDKNINDQERYIINHKIDALKQINL